jgi:hypothetical protein
MTFVFSTFLLALLANLFVVCWVFILVAISLLRSWAVLLDVGCSFLLQSPCLGLGQCSLMLGVHSCCNLLDVGFFGLEHQVNTYINPISRLLECV